MGMFGKECESSRIKILKILQVIKFHSELQQEVIYYRIVSTYTFCFCINEVEFSEQQKDPT